MVNCRSSNFSQTMPAGRSFCLNNNTNTTPRNQMKRRSLDGSSSPVRVPVYTLEHARQAQAQGRPLSAINTRPLSNSHTKKLHSNQRVNKQSKASIASKNGPNSPNQLRGFKLLSVSTRVDCNTGKKITLYDIVVENVRNGRTWQISRRYSDFRRLRMELENTFTQSHCHYCADISSKIKELNAVFPRKCLFRSRSQSVVEDRMVWFQAYIKSLLEIISHVYALNCHLVSQFMIPQLQGFLTLGAIRFRGIAGENGLQVPCLLMEITLARSPSHHMALTTIEEFSSFTLSVAEEDDTTEEEEDDLA